jgi:hypothetical protein
MDRIKEKIGYYKVLVPLVWTGIFLSSSGIGWLLNNHFSFKKLAIYSLIIFIIFLSLSFAFLDKKIRKLLKEL